MLSAEYLKSSSMAEEWKSVSREFFQRWDFPTCIDSYIQMKSTILLFTILFICLCSMEELLMASILCCKLHQQWFAIAIIIIEVLFQ